MLSAKLGHRLDGPLSVFIKNTFLSKISPSTLTLLGLFFNLAAAAAILGGRWKLSALLILAAGLFDMLDGAAARTLNKATNFGGFLDSVVDRYSDTAILLAFIIYYALRGDMDLVALCAVTSVGAMLIPYARARAEAFISHCNVGIMERAERILLIAAGCYFNVMVPVLWILAIATHLTVLQRIYYTWKEIRKA